MRFRYLEWDEERHGSKTSTFEELLDLFEQLLYHTGGDAEEALHWLSQLDEEYGLTDEDMTMQDFVEELKRRGYLRDDAASGTIAITAAVVFFGYANFVLTGYFKDVSADFAVLTRSTAAPREV